MSAGALLPVAEAPAPRSAAAIWSLVLGILSIGCLWIFGSIPAIILGIVALRRIEAAQPPLQGKGAAIAGIVTGAVGTITGLFMIGLIASLLLPITNATMRRAASVHAEIATYQLKNSIQAYHTEYRRYPSAETTRDVTLDSDEALMGVLLGSDRGAGAGGLNPRRVVFYTDRAAKPIGGGGFANGVTLDAEGGGTLWDPWGLPYRVRLDTDGDGRVKNPNPADPAPILEASVLVWSAGPDGDFDTWGDNVKTW